MTYQNNVKESMQKTQDLGPRIVQIGSTLSKD